MFVNVERYCAVPITFPLARKSLIKPRLTITCAPDAHFGGATPHEIATLGEPHKLPYAIELGFDDLRNWSGGGSGSSPRMYVGRGGMEKKLVRWRFQVRERTLTQFRVDRVNCLTAGEMYEEAWTVADDTGCFEEGDEGNHDLAGQRWICWTR